MGPGLTGHPTMTSAAVEYADPSTPAHELAQPVPRSLLRQAYVDTVGRPSARVGIAWLMLLVVLAVFSPFVASSFPLLAKIDGRWSSPVLRFLTPIDVLLLIAAFSGIVLCFWKGFSFLSSVGLIATILVIAVGPVFWLVRPPENIVYSLYREQAGAGRMQWAIHAPIPYSPSDRLRDQPGARLQAPGRDHLLGTDNFASDLASNLIHATRIALSIGFLSTSIALAIGIVVGALMGYYAGALDLIGMRFIEIIESIPRLFLLISITAFIKQRNIYLMMAVLGLTGWTGYARFLRAEFFRIRKLDYVQAAVAVGIPRRSILFRHMLANAMTPLLVATTFGVAGAILTESVLTFLGLGLVNEASWGALLQQARAGGAGFIWWIATFPGLLIFLTVFSYNLIGEAIRDALDPQLRKRD